MALIITSEGLYAIKPNQPQQNGLVVSEHCTRNKKERWTDHDSRPLTEEESGTPNNITSNNVIINEYFHHQKNFKRPQQIKCSLFFYSKFQYKIVYTIIFFLIIFFFFFCLCVIWINFYRLIVRSGPIKSSWRIANLYHFPTFKSQFFCTHTHTHTHTHIYIYIYIYNIYVYIIVIQ